MNIVVTGSAGFLGTNLVWRLRALPNLRVSAIDRNTCSSEVSDALKQCDVLFHLAGVNRPVDSAEFSSVNRDLTRALCERLKEFGRAPKIVFSSSIQASLDNPYGVSKREAEDLLVRFGASTGAAIRIYRLKNVFGKWSRPNYNSVVATFCHNIANDLPIQISDPRSELELACVDDVVDAFLAEVPGLDVRAPQPEIASFKLALGDLVGRIQSFRDMCANLLAPDFAVRFNQQLYATYMSFVPEKEHRHQLEIKSDHRGALVEFIKSSHFGQIFLSRTKPGITRGNHYHHTKSEKFLVLEGEGVVRMRRVGGADVVQYVVRGEEFQVIDIPPGCTHSIENIGPGEMVTLFWTSELYDQDRPDTYFLPVLVGVDGPVRESA